MKTIRDFQRRFKDAIGVPHEKWTPAQIEFWQKLNDMSWSRRGGNPDTVPDIDVTAKLSKAEWKELEAELQSLLKTPEKQC